MDTEQRALFRGGQFIPIAPKLLETLIYLVERHGRIVDKQDLIDAVWRGLVVEEVGLARNVSALRKMLAAGDDSRSYIETVPKRGYRFVAAVTEPQDRDVPDSFPAPAGTGPGSAQVPMQRATLTGAAPDALAALRQGRRIWRRPLALALVAARATRTVPARRPQLSALALIAALAVAVLLTGAYVLWRARPGAGVTNVRVEAPSQSGLPANVAPTSAIAFSPPPHSVAVLPFVNISGDKEQQYFSDGLTEELLNSLAHIDGLQVAARTSSFSFREHPDIADVAHKLNVATVLEGSVRRSGHTIRITAQLNNAVTGFHLWSQTYDRDLSDVLKLQTEIANAVANALKVTLLRDVAAKIALGGTRNPDAFDAYLRAAKHAAGVPVEDAESWQPALDAYTEAIRLDPDYALAFAGRSLAFTAYGANAVYGIAAMRASFDKAEADARKALALAPDLAEGHLALAQVLYIGSQDFVQAMREFDRALALAPNNALALSEYGRFMAFMGHADEGIAASRRALVLDPLNPMIHRRLGDVLVLSRHSADALGAYRDSLALQPDAPGGSAKIGLAYYTLGNLESALSSCEITPSEWRSQECLALVYDRLGRHADAEAVLAKFKAENGDNAAYNNARIYAQWGNAASALQWLDTAVRVRDTGLPVLKVDPLMDPLRKEPRFQAIVRALKFPD